MKLGNEKVTSFCLPEQSATSCIASVQEEPEPP
jgi:hypothetical protein